MRNKTLAIPLTEDERQLVEAAFSQEKRLGDRGGVTAWARQVLLREAAHVARQAAAEIAQIEDSGFAANGTGEEKA